MSYNRVIICGNLGRDCDMRYTTGGIAVANFSVATTEKWTDKQNQRQEKTEWHRVVYWGKGAEAINQFLTKGKQVLVEGRLETNQWEDKDGNQRYTTQVRADRVVLLGGGRSGGREERATEGPIDAPETPGVRPLDDDIPFAWLLPLLLPLASLCSGGGSLLG